MSNLLLQRKKLVATNEDLVTGLERSRDNSFLGLDGEVDLVDRTEDLIDLSDRGLRQILLIHLSIQVFGRSEYRHTLFSR